MGYVDVNLVGIIIVGIVGIVGIALTMFGYIKEIPLMCYGGELMSIMAISCICGCLVVYVN